MMKCALCNGKLISKKEEMEFNSRALGKIKVPNIRFLECGNCGDKLFSLNESEKATAFIIKEEQEALKKMPIGDFVTLDEAANILKVSKQAFSKNPRIKNGLIFSVKIGNRKYYLRKSVELFKENKKNGKFLLAKYAAVEIKETKKTTSYVKKRSTGRIRTIIFEKQHRPSDTSQGDIFSDMRKQLYTNDTSTTIQ